MKMFTSTTRSILHILVAMLCLSQGSAYTQWWNPVGDKDGDGCGSWDITCNPRVKPITKPLVEDLWGEAGQNAYTAASRIMYQSNGSSRPLDDEQKRWLRPLFGSIVDRVAVVYNSRMMERWGIPGTGKDIVLNSSESDGQTYCDRIYLRNSYRYGDIDQIYLLAHELEHSAQCERLGGMQRFGWHYFKEYKRAGLNYENNKLEREAREKANMLQRPSSTGNSSGGVNAQTIISAPQWGGLCLDIANPEGKGPQNGVGVLAFQCHGGGNQNFQISSDGTIRAPRWGGLCLDIANPEGKGPQNGAPVLAFQCHGGSNQIFQMSSDGTIRAPRWGGLCLDIANPDGKGPQNGASVLAFQCHGGANQRWSIGRSRSQ
jgi:hypothetical protein